MLLPTSARPSRLARGAALAAWCAAAAACSDSLGPNEGAQTFSLQAVAGQPLPVELVPVSEASGVRRWWLDAARLTLQQRGVVVLDLNLRSQLDEAPVKHSEEQLRGSYSNAGTEIFLCLGSGCTVRSGNVAHLISGTASGTDIVTPSLFPGVGSPFRFVRD